jgi:hypothetical protein
MSKEQIMELLADDQMKHGEPPDEELLDSMYDALVESAPREYQIAH